MQTVNIQKIKTDIKETAARIQELKAIFRESRQPRLTWQVRGELWALKELATKLCALRAHLRGKLHLSNKMDKAKQAQFVSDLLTEYEIKPIVNESASARKCSESNDLKSSGFEYRQTHGFFARIGAAFREMMSA